MNLKDLIAKIEKLNKMNEELDFDTKYYLVICGRYDKPIYVFNKKDIKKINEYYIDSISNMIINKELVKEERYLYSVGAGDFKYTIQIGVK